MLPKMAPLSVTLKLTFAVWNLGNMPREICIIFCIFTYISESTCGFWFQLSFQKRRTYQGHSQSRTP